MQVRYYNYLAQMPDITVYMNCDTCLAINLSLFDLNEYDEFVFTIKNFDYADSSYEFIFRAGKEDMDERGEVIFNIDPDSSKKIKHGAIYNFAILENAFDKTKLTAFKKITENGKVNIEYGAPDLALPVTEEPASPFSDILSAKLEQTDTATGVTALGVITDLSLEVQ